MNVLISVFLTNFLVFGFTFTARADSLTKNIAVSYSKSVPAFPKTVKNYKLQEKSSVSSERVFEGDKNWTVPISQFDPRQNGGASMSCEPFFWVLRWRSNDPKMTIQATRGITDFGFDPTQKFVEGGAGYASAYGCEVPAFRFGRTTYPHKNNVSYLVDVNFEYQIWVYNPKI
jgi:hypothetical protein